MGRAAVSRHVTAVLLVASIMVVFTLGVPAVSALPLPGTTTTSTTTATAPTIAVSPSSASQGATVTFSGNVPLMGCPLAEPVALAANVGLFPDRGFGPQVTRDNQGNFNTTYMIPVLAPLALYTIGLRCDGGDIGGTTTLTVTASPSPTLAVSPTTAAPGAAVTFSGNVPVVGAQACAMGDDVQLTSNAPLFPASGLGPQATRDSGGSFHATYTVPTATGLGTYTVGLRCGGGNVGVSVMLTVSKTGATSTTSSTSSTTSTTSTTATTSTTVTSTGPNGPSSGSSTTFGIGLPTGPASDAASSHTSSDPSTGVVIVALVLLILVALGLAVSRRRSRS